MENNLDGKEVTEKELDEIMESLGFPTPKRTAPPEQETEKTEEDEMLDDLFKHLGLK